MKAEVVALWFEKQLLSKILEHPNENTCDIFLIATCRHTSYNFITKKTLRKMIFKIDISVEDYRGPIQNSLKYLWWSFFNIRPGPNAFDLVDVSTTEFCKLDQEFECCSCFRTSKEKENQRRPSQHHPCR